MGAAVAIKDAAVKVGTIVSENGKTITEVTDKAGRTVKVADLSRQAANASSFKDSLNTGLDALSLVVAGAGTIPGINLGTVPVQALIGAGKAINNAAHGDMKGAKLAVIEGAVTAGASAIPGGGLATKVAKGATIVGGAVASHMVATSANDEKYDTAALAPAKTPGKPGADKARHS